MKKILFVLSLLILFTGCTFGNAFEDTSTMQPNIIDYDSISSKHLDAESRAYVDDYVKNNLVSAENVALISNDDFCYYQFNIDFDGEQDVKEDDFENFYYLDKKFLPEKLKDLDFKMSRFYTYHLTKPIKLEDPVKTDEKYGTKINIYDINQDDFIVSNNDQRYQSDLMQIITGTFHIEENNSKNYMKLWQQSFPSSKLYEIEDARFDDAFITKHKINDITYFGFIGFNKLEQPITIYNFKTNAENNDLVGFWDKIKVEYNYKCTAIGVNYSDSIDIPDERLLTYDDILEMSKKLILK